MIPKETVKKISESVDIAGYIGNFVQLKKFGRSYKGLCPFHNEKTPSFHVTPQKNVYKCFGCGAYGDVIAFVMNFENHTFIDAVKKIAAYAGIPIVEESRGRRSEKTRERRCMDDALDFFREHLKRVSADSPVGQLIQQRRLSAYTVDKFALGYAPDDWNRLLTFLEAKKYPRELLLSLSLVKKSESGRVYDFYRNRLVFPIRDISGEVIGFGARAIGDELPKYINPPETPLYSKSKVLFGLHEALASIRKNGRIIITEGYIDVIRMAQQGFGESVALCGTAMTPEHMRVFKNMRSPKIVIMPDGDAAGRKSAVKSAKLLLQSGLSGYVCEMTDGLDPGDFFDTHSSEKMDHMLNQALELPYYIVSEAKTLAQGSSNAQMQALDELSQFAAELPPENTDHFLTLTAETFGLRKEVLEGVMQKNIRPAKPVTAAEASDTVSPAIDFFTLHQLYPRDFCIIEGLLSGSIPVDNIGALYPPEMFQDSHLRAFYLRLTSLGSDITELSQEVLWECFPEFRNLIDYIFIFSDSVGTRRDPALTRSIVLELMCKNVFQAYTLSSRSMGYQEKKDAYVSYRKQVDALQRLFSNSASDAGVCLP